MAHGYRQTDPPTPIRISHGVIPRGYRGTLATTGHIVRLIRQGAKDLLVRGAAVEIFRRYGVAAKDFLGEIGALFDWVRRNIRYTRDIYRVELLHTARRMLRLRAGDCDDMAILLGSLLESTGHAVRLVLVGSNPKRPGLYTHIYLEVFHRGTWIPLDPTTRHPMGWKPRAVRRKVVRLRTR